MGFAGFAALPLPALYLTSDTQLTPLKVDYPPSVSRSVHPGAGRRRSPDDTVRPGDAAFMIVVNQVQKGIRSARSQRVNLFIVRVGQLDTRTRAIGNRVASDRLIQCTLRLAKALRILYGS